MRRPLLLAAVLPLVALSACSGSGDPFDHLVNDGTLAAVSARRPAPVLAGRTLGGGSATTAVDKGKVIVVNLWGSWCTPCEAEGDALGQAGTDGAALGAVFLGVDTRDVDNKAQAFRTAHKQTYPSIVDTDGSVSAKWTPFPANATPVTVLIDKQGRVAARFLGAVTYTALMKDVTVLEAEPA